MKAKTKITAATVALLLLILPHVSFSQSDSLWALHKKIADSHCECGQGTGALKRMSLLQLESIVTAKYTQKAFLRLLPKYCCQFNLTFSGDLKTKEWDIPSYEFTYLFVDQNNSPTGISITITIEGDINSRIKYIQVSGISATTYDRFLSALNKTCLYRGSISTEYEKTFVDKAKSLVITLFKNPVGGYKIEIV